MTGPVEFGITWVVDDVLAYGDLAAACEAAGFSLLGVPDSHASTYRDLYVAMTVALSHTRKVTVASMVTNPVTRHPAVTANATATLVELSGGRAAVGLGTGDSAVMTLGHRPARVREVEEYVVAMRDLLGGKRTLYEGREVQPAWFDVDARVLMGAVGPRMLRLGGRIGDGVVTNTGVSPEIVASVSQHVARGADEAGKDAAALPIWWVVRASIESDRDTAVRMVAPSLAAAANSTFKLGLQGKQLPTEFEPAITELLRRYEYRDHSRRADDNLNANLLEELGLLEYLADRYAVAGTPSQCAEQIGSMIAAGATKILLRPQSRDRPGFVRRWREEVLPILVDRGIFSGVSSRS